MPTTRNYLDPVIPGVHPDPSVCRVGDDFYLITSSFEYFPGLPLFHSTDLVTWRQLGHVLTRESQLDLLTAGRSGGLYAPTIRHHDGRFYVACTNVGGRGHFIVSTDNIAGEWSDPVWVDQDGIDPDLFFEDGRCYFSSTVEPDVEGPHELEPQFVRGIQQSIIDPLTGERLTEPRFLWAGSGGSFPEAPHLYRRGKYYYLLLAEGGTEYGHMVTVARATSPSGPWQAFDDNPILTHRSMPLRVQATGHADLVELADGSWWAVALGIRPVGTFHHLGRETFLAPVTWVDDWPIVGDGGRLPAVATAPPLPRTPGGPLPADDSFGGPVLAPCWNTVRRPLTDKEANLTERPGALRLRGGPDTTDGQLPVMVARRQQHLACTVRGHLDFEPVGQDEAGVTVRMDEQHHVDLAVTAGHNGRRQVSVTQRIGPVRAVLSSAVVEDGPLVLRVDATPVAFAFSVEHEGGGINLGSTPTQYLSAEVARSFTGVFFGLYATGRGTPAIAPADWTRFSYIPA